MADPYQRVFSDSDDPILIEDLTGIVIDMNRQAELTYGWERDELIGKPIKTIVPPERHSQADELLQQCKSGQEVRNVEGLRKTKDGTIVPVLLTLSLLKDDSGKPLGIATIAKDISVQKETETELRKLAKVFMDAVDPILVEDLNGIVIDMNRQAELTYGWERDELISKPIKTIVPPERHSQADELLQQCKSGQEVRNVEGLRKTKDGTIVPVLLTLSLLNDDSGTSFGIATIAKDISAQKETEAELRMLSKVFMDSVDPILVEDLNGIVSDMNKQAELTYGWERDELIGKPIKTIVPPERHSQADELLQQCKSGQEVRNVEGLRKTKDGTIVPVLLTLSLLKDDSGNPTRIVTIAKDISSLKKAESKLLEYKNLLEKKVALRTQELEETNTRLREVRAQISKYIDPNVTEKIFKGEFEAALGHQRKKLTMFFSDIKDFTQFTDASDPEDVAKLLNEYLGIMARIVRKWGGTIPQFTGDSIYAIFGAPDTKGTTEDALACVRMALDMQDDMKILQEKWWNQGIQFPFKIRCGIHTGMANVGNYGSDGFMEYSAIGLNTNLASRLEQACEPGKIYLSHATWALVNKEISCEEVGAIEVKGFHYPIQTYRVIQNSDS